MGHLPGAPLPYRNLFRALFLLAAADSLAWGLTAIFFSQKLFQFLQLPATHRSLDALHLWRVLGLVMAAHALVAFLLQWPEKNGPLAVVLLLGRAINTSVWLWLGNTQRLPLPPFSLLLLVIHDGLWVPVFFGFLLCWLL